MNNMTILQPICAVLNRWIGETRHAEDSAGHNHHSRREAVKALGRIHYIIWLEDIHEKKNITAGDILIITLLYSMETIHDLVMAPFNIIMCHRR